VRLHEQRALRAAFLMVQDPTDAADVTQEAFIKAYDALGRFKLGNRFQPWLMRIVLNQA
jgi:RNA polymerase sigma-70 factor (ECF subfamily)